MNPRVILAGLVAQLAVLSIAHANTGAFFGAGNQVVPIRDDNIRLVRENVEFKLDIPDKNPQPDWGVPFTPWVRVKAQFWFENTKDSPVQLQMGFPFLDLQGFGNEEFVLKNMNFEVQCEGDVRKVVLKEGLLDKDLDPKDLFKKVFAWDESFDARQSKTVVVTYSLLMGFAAMNSPWRKEGMGNRTYEDIDEAIPALDYTFNYITGTARTWKGPLEQATFSLDATQFLSHLEDKRVLKEFTTGAPVPINRPILLTMHEPSENTVSDGKSTWLFHDSLPEGGISLNFGVCLLPAEAGEVDHVFEQLDRNLRIAKRAQLMGVIDHLYSAVLSEKDSPDEFTLKYSRDTWLEKFSGKLLFERDREGIVAARDAFRKLNTATGHP